MRFHQETEIAVLAEIRGQEYFRRLALPTNTKKHENAYEDSVITKQMQEKTYCTKRAEV